jgi:hypothetical protein
MSSSKRGETALLLHHVNLLHENTICKKFYYEMGAAGERQGEGGPE